MKLVAGLDIGNGYVKGLVRCGEKIKEVDIPSGVMIVTRPNLVPIKDDKVDEEIKDFYNRLDTSFVTPMIKDNYRRLFGERSLNASGAFEEFDVLGNRSKAQQELSKILVLGIIAGSAVKFYYEQHKKLPEADGVLSVECKVALALPIGEYNSFRHIYAEEFKNGVHTVTIHNFETPITVKLKFDNVQVTAEGASAQYAIIAKGEPLMDAMLLDLKKRGLSLDGVTSKDILAVKNTIGIDIGEGTVNFPVFSGGRFNTDSSKTLNKGYGSVLTGALQNMQESGVNGFNSRKQLASYLQNGPSPIKKNHYMRVKGFVDEEIVFFAKEVAEKFGHVLANSGASVEVAYVYGGGATAVKEVLYPLLIEKVKEINGMDAFPVLYLNSDYSRHLNREGLYLMVDIIDKKNNGTESKK